MSTSPTPRRDAQALLARVRQQWGGHGDLWVFGYGSLIWRPDFEHTERHLTRVQGWHRSLKMWSHVNRGTPERPGLVLALLPGGSCRGVVFRVPRRAAEAVLQQLWQREMPLGGVYDPRWLPCATPHGRVAALAFTLSRGSPAYTGDLSDAHYRDIFRHAHGRYGSTLDYVRVTEASLRQHGITDRALQALLRHAD